MVRPAPAPDGVFLEDSPARGGLAGVEDGRRLRPLDLGHESSRQRRHAAEPLEEVQHAIRSRARGASCIGRPIRAMVSGPGSSRIAVDCRQVASPQRRLVPNIARQSISRTGSPRQDHPSLPSPRSGPNRPRLPSKDEPRWPSGRRLAPRSSASASVHQRSEAFSRSSKAEGRGSIMPSPDSILGLVHVSDRCSSVAAIFALASIAACRPLWRLGPCRAGPCRRALIGLRGGAGADAAAWFAGPLICMIRSRRAAARSNSRFSAAWSISAFQGVHVILVGVGRLVAADGLADLDSWPGSPPRSPGGSP